MKRMLPSSTEWNNLIVNSVVVILLWATGAGVYAQTETPQVASTSASSPAAASSLQAWENMNDNDAWARLPQVAQGHKGRLPNWVKPVALQMPRTAGAMLELDAIQRTQGPIESGLKARLRWIIAQANQCDYTQAVALGDLKRVDSSPNDWSAKLSNPALWPAAEADAYRFVQMLSTEAPAIPDALFDSLRAAYGDRGAAAIVLLTAYGNFQDRLCLGLQVPLETDGPLPPVDVKFVSGALQRTPIRPGNNGEAVYTENGKAINVPDKQWTSLSYETLQARLEEQRNRKPRLPVPTWEEVKAKLPADMGARPTGIRWNLVTYGYAAELAIPWTTMTRTHWAELPSERILEESLFWVQTRAVHCNYCMGHCEMLLESAGLDAAAVAKRTKLLAETDWADFPPSEQVAYGFARKLSATPQQLVAADYAALEKAYGPRQAMSIFIWLCRGLYMTRISDGFQLPLERENVFGAATPAPNSK